MLDDEYRVVRAIDGKSQGLVMRDAVKTRKVT
jgi:hypothetical protein